MLIRDMLAGTSLLLALLAILSLVGISIYFYMDFDKHKTSNEVDFKKAETDLSKEKSDRLSNLSFVIDQVNAVNKDIKTTYDLANATQDNKLMTYGSNISVMNTSLTGMGTSMAMFNASLTGLSTKVNGIETGFGSLLSLKDGSTSVPLSTLSSVASPNIDLIKNISVLSGMTIKDVQTSKQFKVCGGVPERCVSFPDAQGNTYLTGFGKDASVVLDAPVEAKQDIILQGKLYQMVNGQKVEIQLNPVGLVSAPPPSSTQTPTVTTVTSTQPALSPPRPPTAPTPPTL